MARVLRRKLAWVAGSSGGGWLRTGGLNECPFLCDAPWGACSSSIIISSSSNAWRDNRNASTSASPHHHQQQQRHMAAAAAAAAATTATAAPAAAAVASSTASASPACSAAAADVLLASSSSMAAAASAVEAAAHARRLRELLLAPSSSAAAAAAAGQPGFFSDKGASPTPAPQQQQQQQQQRHRRLDLSSVPMLQVRKAGAQQQQQQQPARRPLPPHAPAAPAVDWREIVERARRQQQEQQQQEQQHLSGAAMLTDTFGRRHTYLRISLTERCNLRCTYCMPEEGVELTPGPQLLSADEVVRLAGLFAAAGVDKIRLTGGEPTLRRDLPDIVARLAALPGVKTVAMTSNGVALARQLPALRAAGLSALNVSLDTLDPSRFAALTRRPAAAHARVLDAIDAALETGLSPVKVNVVAMRGVNDGEVADFAALTRDRAINVRFIEYMPFDGNAWGSGGKLVPYAEMRAAVEARFPGLERLRDPAGEVAKNFAVPGHKGSVSFVTSMTHAFCGDCNRLRLLADGSLKVCLFGANEVSLRDALRSGATDAELRLVVSAAVDRKRAAHAGMHELAAAANRPMITIGG